MIISKTAIATEANKVQFLIRLEIPMKPVTTLPSSKILISKKLDKE